MNLWREVRCVTRKMEKIWFDHGEVAERIDARVRHTSTPLVRREVDLRLGDKRVATIEVYPAGGGVKVNITEECGVTILHHGHVPESNTSDELQEVVSEMVEELKKRCKKRIKECKEKLEKAKPLLAVSGGE